MASFAYELEEGLGNPGLRAICAYGEVSQVFEPDEGSFPGLANQLMHWFVLTGANQAVVKCDEALRVGKGGGFLHNQFWYERLDREYEFRGAPLSTVPTNQYGTPNLYERLFESISAASSLEARLRTDKTPGS